MKTIILLLLTYLCSYQAAAQYDDVKQLMIQGATLHDSGKYDDAIAKYDEALAIDPRNMELQYEKSFSLYAAKRFDEARKLCEKMIDNFKGIAGMENVYCNLGSIYDDTGDPKKAIKTYNKGIDYFPGFSLLYFNRGLTQMKIKEYDDALVSLKKSATLRTSHLSTNYWLAELVVNDNKYAGLLAYLTYLVFDRQTERAAGIWKTTNKILEAGVTRTGANSTTINISMDMLNKKKKPEDDFSSLELMVPLMTASKSDSALKSITKDEAGALSFQMQLVFGLLKNSENKKGFFWTHYAPIFDEMKEKGHVETFARLLKADLEKDSGAKSWLETHPDELVAFQTWLEGYK
ncbi:MAG: tetratricopeptide repeat protein [Bacteroidota bacterium]